MKIDRINYQKTFNLGNYTSERIGMEAEVEQGQDLMECYKILKDAVEKFHKDNNPQLTEENKYENKMTDAHLWTTITATTIPTKDISNESTTEDKIIEQIMQSSDLKVLDSFKLIAGKSSRLDAAFQERRNQLQSLQK